MKKYLERELIEVERDISFIASAQSSLIFGAILGSVSLYVSLDNMEKIAIGCGVLNIISFLFWLAGNIERRRKQEKLLELRLAQKELESATAPQHPEAAC